MVHLLLITLYLTVDLFLLVNDGHNAVHGEIMGFLNLVIINISAIFWITCVANFRLRGIDTCREIRLKLHLYYYYHYYYYKNALLGHMMHGAIILYYY